MDNEERTQRVKANFLKIGIFTVLTAVIVISVFLLKPPSEYMVTTENRFDYQAHLECSGYSSAYVLRSLGVDVNGLDVYNDISDKNKDGTVSPEPLVEYLESKGYNAALHTERNLWEMEKAISEGTPVIAFVKTAPNEPYLHYLPIVGYDKESIYAADSLPYKKNSDAENYNRKLSVGDFEKMWDSEYYPRTYITIKLK